MEKKVYTEIKRELQSRCETNPQILELRDSKKAGVPQELKRMIWLFKHKNRHKKLGEHDNTQYKNKVIYAVIHSGIYDKDIVEGLYVKLVEIEERYNQYRHALMYLFEQPDFAQFQDYVYSTARAAHVIEVQKAKEFESSTVLNQLVNWTPPIYWSRKMLSRFKLKFDNANKMFDEAWSKFIDGKITENQAEIERVKRDEDCAGAFSFIHYEQVRLTRWRDEATDTSFKFIDAVGSSHLLENPNPNVERLRIKTVTSAKWCLQEYCRWYNRTHLLEILADQTVRKQHRDVKRYGRIHAEEKLARAQRREAEKTNVYNLHLQGISLREISRTTGISYGNVQRIVSLINSISSDQNSNQ